MTTERRCPLGVCLICAPKCEFSCCRHSCNGLLSRVHIACCSSSPPPHLYCLHALLHLTWNIDYWLIHSLPQPCSASHRYHYSSFFLVRIFRRESSLYTSCFTYCATISSIVCGPYLFQDPWAAPLNQGQCQAVVHWLNHFFLATIPCLYQNLPCHLYAHPVGLFLIVWTFFCIPCCCRYSITWCSIYSGTVAIIWMIKFEFSKEPAPPIAWHLFWRCSCLFCQFFVSFYIVLFPTCSVFCVVCMVLCFLLPLLATLIIEYNSAQCPHLFFLGGAGPHLPVMTYTVSWFT